MSLKTIFMGTPDFSVPTLSEVLGAGHEVVAVYTQPPRPAGRGKNKRPSPVHVFAETAGLTVFTPQSLKSENEQAEFQAHSADVAVVVAYGLILPRPVLDAPGNGCLNLHASLLPRWRGAAPIQRAIMAGDSETGAMVMRMDEGLDTGPVCLAGRTSISDTMTAGELHDILAREGADLMVRALAALERGSLECKAQAGEGVTYAAKIEKSETRIDWSRTALQVHNHIRGLSPWPGVWFEAVNNGTPERIKVLRSELVLGAGAPGTALDDQLTIACGEGAIRPTELQRAGKKPVSRQEFIRGFKIAKGMQLT